MEPITIFNLALWGLVICAVAASFWLASAPKKLREKDEEKWAEGYRRVWEERVRERESMEQSKTSSKNEE